MAVTATHLLTAASGTNATSYETASVNLSANKLVLLSVINAAASVTTPTVTGASRTWTQIDTQVDGAGLRRITLFRSLSSSANSGALTIDFGVQEQARCGWSISEFGNVDTTGVNGANAVVQSAKAAGTGTTSFTINLAAFGSVDNATYGTMCLVEINVDINPGTGFTELEQAHTGETGSIQTEWKDSNDTSVDWTFADSANDMQCGIAVEIKFAELTVSTNYLKYYRRTRFPGSITGI